MSDAKGRLVLQNEAAERIWAGSATAESVSEWGRYRAFHPDGRPFEGADWAMARCLERQEVVEAEEFHIQRFDGSFGWLVGSSAPLLGEAGELLGAVSIFVDVTELKQVEADNRRRALEINDDVVQGVTAARIALEVDRPDDARESLAEALAAARKIVNDLLGGGPLPAGTLRRSDPADPA
jgi:PAS domain S-box-containing protein